MKFKKIKLMALATILSLNMQLKADLTQTQYAALGVIGAAAGSVMLFGLVMAGLRIYTGRTTATVNGTQIDINTMTVEQFTQYIDAVVAADKARVEAAGQTYTDADAADSAASYVSQLQGSIGGYPSPNDLYKYINLFGNDGDLFMSKFTAFSRSSCAQTLESAFNNTVAQGGLRDAVIPDLDKDFSLLQYLTNNNITTTSQIQDLIAQTNANGGRLPDTYIPTPPDVAPIQPPAANDFKQQFDSLESANAQNSIQLKEYVNLTPEQQAALQTAVDNQLALAKQLNEEQDNPDTQEQLRTAEENKSTLDEFTGL